MGKNKNNKHSKRLRRKKKRCRNYEQEGNVETNNRVVNKLKDSLNYLHAEYGNNFTDKDKLQGKWVERRAEEIRKSSGYTDSLLFRDASIAVSELESLYDTIEVALRTKFPTVNIDFFFRTITMYVGKNVSGVYTYLTDWKTLMFTIAGSIPEAGTFPTIGFDYDLAVSPYGLLGIQTKQGNMIALIPVFPGAEKTDGRIYPQNGEPLKNGNLEYDWEKWYELNRLVSNEKDWFKSMKYYDEILEHTLSNNLFNRKKINVA